MVARGRMKFVAPPLLLLLLLLVLTSAAAAAAANDESSTNKLWMGPRNRFWKHHVTNRELLIEGNVNQYDKIEACLAQKMSEFDKTTDKEEKKERTVGMTITDDADADEDYNNEEVTVVVVIKNAMSPEHVHAVQSLASCVRAYIPGSYESRAMYQEMNLDEDPGLGGNCPTHLAPLVSIFLPQVVRGMQETLELAYQTAGWDKLVQADHATIEDEDDDEDEEELPYRKKLHPPSVVGMRASEHLTYKDFPILDEHTDGDTAYTMNFAFSDDYSGGAFYVVLGQDTPYQRKQHIKPSKYDALVFLGGRYLHGVAPITGGNREMYSTEFWPYPDTPYGSNLWTNHPDNMEEYIRRCNPQQRANNAETPCTAPFPTVTAEQIELADVRAKYNDDEEDDEEEESGRLAQRPNRQHPSALTPIRVRDDATGQEYDLDDNNGDDSYFWNAETEPDFLLPKTLSPAEMVPIRWRDTMQPVDGYEGESYVIGFPPELHSEFVKYIQNSGMMQVAHDILYTHKQLQPEEHRLYTLKDGHKWGAMVQGTWNSDMVWLDPGDEACFESLLSVLRRGNFDAVLDKVGKAFDLNGLMIQGVGAIFLSEYEALDNMHIDIPGSKGSFYNIIVPVHIPANETAKFYIGQTQMEDDDENDRVGLLNLHPGSGVVLGGESQHGTGECNYKGNTNAEIGTAGAVIGDFRLSFAIYVADIDDDNVELIASDSTSLWPTSGDVDWFWAQQGRLWSKTDTSVSLKNDKGRKPMKIQDQRPNCEKMQHLCEEDVQGLRLQCPKTCQLYLQDDVYYEQLAAGKSADIEMPTCLNSNKDGSPSCAAAEE